ncbi:pseudouridine synthase [Paracidovorax citrulli]|uniref:Pseudouridine synthase n=3 Tax=Paracidovorax citrulli TaxID=80869 RepID=A1TPH7_PARC0|nr:pseudouridine synthase [Paracidovorax citrulli]ABM32865.1 ribosomal large subunit pseudouridine synthase E [Paracidovorax citrulli AAC00-1]ATG96824.1 pseudouridine synthase [Paracidovorax citrulli]MVT29107.1 pseudouridine synthase [Paracidovorax citrulli]PVY67083.1 ribosomal large subunit pseudouridine synthase E [Paracidovorax citrulli]QCX12929.1 Ribosomal large subunit pseudouridine synthase E [Paracidovorax citrulli]
MRPGDGRRRPSPRPGVRLEPVERAGPSRLLRFHKPYGVLSQFTPEGRWRGLKDFIDLPGVYVAGRLDADSEGLLLLTDDGGLQARIADPRFKMEKTYWVQVEGVPDAAALQALERGVQLNDGPTLPARARRLDVPPPVGEREPPIRVRQHIPDTWIELVIREGRNRQVRRMTAAVGHPTLRLVRAAIGPFALDGLAPGTWAEAEIPAALAVRRPGTHRM